MKKLSQKDMASRRRFDWRVVQKMPNSICRFSAHNTPQDAEAGRSPIVDETDARCAAHYRAVYSFPTLVGPGKYGQPTIIRIDAADSKYPFASPSSWVVEKNGVFPWSPHFARGLPVCDGTIWRNNAQVLLGHYLIHLARLLNWDEILEDGYGGYNERAANWWRKNRGRPLHPDLVYPCLPVDELYGDITVRTVGGFRLAANSATRDSKGRFQRVR